MANILQKGESIEFLDYTIQNSKNDDGLVLFKRNGHLHECHLGNFGVGTEIANINLCKKYALYHFMLARPSAFASIIASKLHRKGSGLYGEYITLEVVLRKEGIPMPAEITTGDGINTLIHFNGEPI